MAVRQDISINFEVSPRIVLVAAPSVEITMQDLVDTVRTIEALSTSMDNDHILDAGGKQVLGGGVLVGITITLRNAQLAFEARPGPTYTQCNVSGGNLVAIDDVGAPLNPISPTAFTQIVLANSSSATLSEQSAIQYASFGGGIWVDTVIGVAGEDYPIGTQENPSSNLTDAHEIIEERGFDTFFFTSDYTFDSGVNLTDGYLFVGESSQKTTFTFQAGSILTDSQFKNSIVTGTIAGPISFEDAHVVDLTFSEGASSRDIIIVHSFFEGTITIDPDFTGTLSIVDCWATPTASGTPPIIDMNGAACDLQIRNLSGFVTIKNCTQANDVRVFLISGGISLDSTCTDGNYVFTGVGTLVDDSSGTTISANGLTNIYDGAQAVWEENTADHVDHGTFGAALSFIYGIEGGRWKIVSNQMIFYADDNTTEIARFDLTDSGGSPAMENIYERTRT